MSREVSHKASNTDVTYTNYMHHNIVSTSTHTILQVGGRCTAYSINVTRGFLDAIKDKGGRLTFSVLEEPLLQLSWEGNIDVSQACTTKWKVDVLSVFKGCKSAIMREISKDIFDPLRREIIEQIYHEHDAQLSALLGGSLIFVFMHRNRHDADKMIEKKHEINKIFQQLFGHIGNMEVKFSLFAERDAKARQWIQRLVEEPTGNYPSDDSSESVKSGNRTDSIVTELKQLREEVSEMKNILCKISHKVLSDTYESKTTPLSQTEEWPTTILLPEKYTMDTIVPVATVATATSFECSPFCDEKPAEDGDMGLEHSRQQNRLDLTVAKNYERAFMMLKNLPVCNDVDQFNRLAMSVAVALEDEDPEPPRSVSLSTVLCLDVSESMGQKGFEEVKQAAHKFVDGIETIAERHELVENLALVVMGGGARVVRHLTNDYTAIRDAIDGVFMGGRSPIIEALVVCIAALDMKGGTLMIDNVHKVKQRIIFLTDGYATDESVVEGPDLTEVDGHGRIHLIQLTRAITSTDVVWVAVGNADENFLRSLCTLGHGSCVECKKIESLWKHFMLQRNIARIYHYVRAAKFEETPEAIGEVVQALTDMDVEDRKFVTKGVKQKFEVPDKGQMSLDYHNVQEVSALPPLGTRVVRGPDWQHENQDCEGTGTIVNHASDRDRLWVLWDFNGVCGQYRFGHDGKMDVVEVEDQPRILLEDELIEIGVRVKRGVDWSHGDQDGGEGSTGVVVRKREDGVVKVKWQNGNLKSYKYGLDGKMEVAVCEPDDFMKVPSGSQDATTNTERTSIADVGCATPTEETPHIVWQWQDDKEKWHVYRDSDADKLEKEFTRKPFGSCVLQKEGRSCKSSGTA
ncbi:uncharacterized protein [Haliotis asinina]|uniref:uncharacterized protein n=1 Tax=Haliotis asinina TaxID=109174 RepID=UPI003531AE63